LTSPRSATWHAEHTEPLRAYNRQRSESRRGYQREYQRRRRALIAAGNWKTRASRRCDAEGAPAGWREHPRVHVDPDSL